MTLYGPAVLFALFVWFASTGVIIYLNNLPQATIRWSMLGATIVLALCLQGLAATANDVSVSGAYAAFTCGLLAWGWQEISFFSGVMIGPRRAPCPPDAQGWRRFSLASQTCLYHEAASLACALAIVTLTRGGENQIGAWTYTALWAMRLSAKLNVFLGVPNLFEQFLPSRIAFLAGYFRRAPINLLFPVSVTLSTLLATVLVVSAVTAASPFVAAGATLLATLMVLGVIEHWFMVLPLPFAAIWDWSLRARTDFPESGTMGATARSSREVIARAAGRG